MCLAVPSQVVDVASDGTLLVDAFGMRRTVSAALMEAPPAAGDYVLVRAGGYAIECVEPDRSRETLALLAADGLEAAFRRIERERMEGVALLNRALRVEAIGFAPWGRHWLGVLVSPWFVNLVLVRGSADDWPAGNPDEAVFHEFPCGRLAFLAASEPEVGEFQSCALTTAMHEFPGQDTARDFARAALEALQRPPAPLAEPARPREAMTKRQFLHTLLLRPT